MIIFGRNKMQQTKENIYLLDNIINCVNCFINMSKSELYGISVFIIKIIFSLKKNSEFIRIRCCNSLSICIF